MAQRHDVNQIYGCLMVPVDLHLVHTPEDDPKTQVEQTPWRKSWHISWKRVHLPSLRHAKRPTA